MDAERERVGKCLVAVGVGDAIAESSAVRGGAGRIRVAMKAAKHFPNTRQPITPGKRHLYDNGSTLFWLLRNDFHTSMGLAGHVMRKFWRAFAVV